MLGRNDADMGPANSLHASAYYSEYNERFDLSMKTTVNKFYQATRNVDCRLFVEIKLLYANCSLSPEEHYSEAVMARISGINSNMFNVTLYSAKYFFVFAAAAKDLYYIYGVCVGLSLVHGGPGVHCMSPVLYNQLVDKPRNYIEALPSMIDCYAHSKLLKVVTQTISCSKSLRHFFEPLLFNKRPMPCNFKVLFSASAYQIISSFPATKADFLDQLWVTN